MVRLCRTFSNDFFTGETRFAGCLGTSSVREGSVKPVHALLSLACGGSRKFDALEPPRTSVRAPGTPCFFC